MPRSLFSRGIPDPVKWIVSTDHHIFHSFREATNSDDNALSTQVFDFFKLEYVIFVFILLENKEVSRMIGTTRHLVSGAQMEV